LAVETSPNLDVGSLPGRASPEVRLARLAGALTLTCFGMALAMLAVRDLVIHQVPVPGTEQIPSAASLFQHNKLCGWFHIGGVPFSNEFSWTSLWAGLIWEWTPGLFTAAGVLCLVASQALRYRLAGGERALPRRRLHGGWPGVLAAVWTTGIALLVAWRAFERIPHVQDSIAQLFQARIFASGRLWARVPEYPEFFGLEFLVADRGRWYSQYPPGHPALLAIGVLIGAPWLVNPVLGGLSVLPIYFGARAAYGEATARLAAVLYSLSPFVWFMSGEFMNHTSTMFFVAIATGAMLIGLRRRERRPMAARIAGLAMALAASCRPLSAVAMAPAIALGCCGSPRRTAKGGWIGWLSPVLHFAAAFAVGLIPMLAVNLATTGSPLRFGYEVQWGTSGLGFGNSQFGPPHSPVRGLFQTWSNLDALNKYLFEWPVPSLWPLLGLWFLRRRWRWADTALVAAPVLLATAYFFYFYQDLCLGPRFLYCATPAVVLLIARGTLALGGALARAWGLAPAVGRTLIVRAIAVCTLIGLAGNLPVLTRWYSRTFWGTSPRLERLVRREGVRHAIVFIRDGNRARAARLVRMGVPPRVAHSAMVYLDETWIDQQAMRVAERSDLSPEQRAAELTRILAAAALSPLPYPRREHPPWIDRDRPTVSFTLGCYANTPDLDRQNVIYALDLGERNELLIARYPDRAIWEYGWDPQTRRFELKRVPRPQRPPDPATQIVTLP